VPAFDDDKLRVLEASDIASVVGEYVRLVPKGREFVCLCPFHDDHSPSMYVVPHKRMFHCFVCGAGGDVFSFIQRYHGVDFSEAMRMLAERAGIELTPWKRAPGEDAPRLGRSALIEANRRAMGFFQTILRGHAEGAGARAVIDRRGIAPAMVERFGLGAAPDRWDGLLTTIRAKGLDDAAFLAVGLLKKGDRPEPYDALRNRLIFPILGETGEPIAFGARRIDDADEPKYLNSPESPLFNKSRTLFGLPIARDAIRKSGRAVVVEGYTDVIACHQAGLAHVVGTLGTAFTVAHAQKLRGQCAEVVLLFDGDEAGQNAADRAIEVLIGAKLDIRVAMLTGKTNAKDPDELLRRPGGIDQLRRILDTAEPVLDRWARRIREKQASMGPAGRARYLDEQVARLAQTGLDALSPIERDSMLASLAGALGLPHRLLIETYGRVGVAGRRAGAPGGSRDGGGAGDRVRPVDRFRARLLACLLEPLPAGVIEAGRVARALRVDLEGCPAALARLAVEAAGEIERVGVIEPARLLATAHGGEESSAIAGLLAAERFEEGGQAEELRACLDRLEAHELRTGGGGGEPATDPTDRLARLRALHASHGQNTGANPYRLGDPRGGGRGPYDREGVRERSDDGQDQDDRAGASPGAR
jgi:DNA primase